VVAALGVGETAAGAGEVWIKRSRVLVCSVGVTTGCVALPDLYQVPGQSVPVGAQEATRDVDALPLGGAAMAGGEIRVLRMDIVGPE
jgi:hypothetical protein